MTALTCHFIKALENKECFLGFKYGLTHSIQMITKSYYINLNFME